MSFFVLDRVSRQLIMKSDKGDTVERYGAFQTVDDAYKYLTKTCGFNIKELGVVFLFKKQKGGDDKMADFVCPKCKATGDKIVGVEYQYPNPNAYDGISEWQCLSCNSRFGRWSKKVLKDGEWENPDERYKQGNEW